MEWSALAVSIMSAVFAAGGAYAAVRVELKFLWRELDRLALRVQYLSDQGMPRRRVTDHPGPGA